MGRQSNSTGAGVPATPAKTLEKIVCLPINHSLTGQALPSKLFLTFLVHRLILPVAPVSDTNTDKDKAPLDKTVTPEMKMKEVTRSIVGNNVDDAATYLLAALASRPGDGRRRTIDELIACLRLDNNTLDSTQRLTSAMKTAKVIQQLITPPVDWAARDTFLVPSR